MKDLLISIKPIYVELIKKEKRNTNLEKEKYNKLIKFMYMKQAQQKK